MSQKERRVVIVPSADIEAIDQLGPRTRARLRAALMLVALQSADIVLFTGGRCHSPEIETQAAAVLMDRWWSKESQSKEVVVENRARDTFENISFSLGLLRERYPNDQLDIVIVSHWLHAIRMAITFRLAHGTKVKREGIRYPIGLKDTLIELAMIAYHLLDWKGRGWLARKNRENRSRAASGQ